MEGAAAAASMVASMDNSNGNDNDEGGSSGVTNTDAATADDVLRESWRVHRNNHHRTSKHWVPNNFLPELCRCPSHSRQFGISITQGHEDQRVA
ncbi:hypothetical protein ACA910_001923 [Epithemia clementina (nom. ined.)]